MTFRTNVKFIIKVFIIGRASSVTMIRNTRLNVDTLDTVEGVCNGFLPYTRFLGFLEFSGYHQWQQESQ